MELDDQRSMPPLIVVAAIALILFCAAGVAALMGWIPKSISGEEAASPPQSAASPPAGAAAAKSRSEPARVASGAPAASRCPECGVVESVREVNVQGKASGVGAVGGAVVGGVVGNQVGGGRGKDVMTVLGAVGGALAGNQVEKNMKTTKSYEITIRLEDGSTRVLHESSLPSWRPGDRVKVVDGQIRPSA